jgi:hypothetical protein
MDLPKRRVAAATLFALLVCIGAIAAAVVLVKRQDAPADPAVIRGGQIPVNQEETSNMTSGMEVGAETPKGDTAAKVEAPPTQAAATALPTALPTADPRNNWGETTFYVIADVPYNDRERDEMPGLVAAIPEDAAFAVHLGDIKHGDASCNQGAIDTFVGFVKKSAVPMFVVVGDNEYNDCSSPRKALELWRNGLVRFDQIHWNHSLPVRTMDNRPESFYFTNKGTLFIGLNIVGTPAFSNTEWRDRLETQLDWTIQLIEGHRTGDDEVGAVVIFAHASPNGEHDPFFDPFRNYIRNILQNSMPILYLCGDVHSYLHDPNYENQPSWLRVRSEGGSRDPPLKVVVRPPMVTGRYDQITDVFDVTRFWQE